MHSNKLALLRGKTRHCHYCHCGNENWQIKNKIASVFSFYCFVYSFPCFSFIPCFLFFFFTFHKKCYSFLLLCNQGLKKEFLFFLLSSLYLSFTFHFPYPFSLPPSPNPLEQVKFFKLPRGRGGKMKNVHPCMKMKNIEEKSYVQK